MRILTCKCGALTSDNITPTYHAREEQTLVH